MRDSQAGFIDFMVAADVLTFGDFVTKSGRKTPYFVNTGLYSTAAQLKTLGRAYAAAIAEHLPSGSFDVLFGPAYKGIPLAVTVALALFELTGHDVPFCFNRKEAKGHGEGGVLVGHKLQDGDRVLIVEDVTTAGTSIRETVPVLRAAAQIELAGLIVSVDRMERAPSTRLAVGATEGVNASQSALEAVAREHDMPARAIVTLDDIVERLQPGGGAPGELTAEQLSRIDAYRQEFGVQRS